MHIGIYDVHIHIYFYLNTYCGTHSGVLIFARGWPRVRLRDMQIFQYTEYLMAPTHTRAVPSMTFCRRQNVCVSGPKISYIYGIIYKENRQKQN